MSKVLAKIIGLVFVVGLTIVISVAMSCMILIKMLDMNTNGYVALGAAILVALGICRFIVYNHKIWDFVLKRKVYEDNE